MRSASWVGICGIGTALLAFPAQGALLKHEAFDYTAGTTAASNGYTTTATVASDPVIVSGSLNYSGLETSTGNALQFGRRHRQITSPTFSPSVPAAGTSVYVSFLVRVDTLGTDWTNTSGNTILNLQTTAPNSRVAVGLTRNNAEYHVRLAPNLTPNPSPAPTNSADTYIVGETLLIVARLNYISNVSGSTWTVSTDLWINPDSSTFGTNTPPVALISSPEGDVTGGITSFSTGIDNPGNLPQTLLIDEVRVGTTWADVTPVFVPIPEPASAMTVVAAGLFGMVLHRRRPVARA
jgi:hypothetical protein